MTREIAKKYANITRDALELFKSYCEECQKKRKRPMTKGLVVRPILTNEFPPAALTTQTKRLLQVNKPDKYRFLSIYRYSRFHGAEYSCKKFISVFLNEHYLIKSVFLES